MNRSHANPENYQPLVPVDPNRRYSVDLACSYLGISRPKFYDKINDGTIKTFTDGRRRFVPGTEILRLSRLPEE